MSSSIAYEKCPRCGGVLTVEFDCMTFEEWESCNRCGRRGGWHYVRDEDGEIVLGEDKQPQKESDDLIGYGAAYFQFDGVGVCYSLPKPFDEEEKLIFYKELNENDKLKKEKCYLSVWDEELGNVRAEYGVIPENYEEFEDQIKSVEAQL